LAKIVGIQNVSRSEKIAYNAFWRDFIFTNFRKMSFSTATQPRLLASVDIDFRFARQNEAARAADAAAWVRSAAVVLTIR
jgi:hypothetical protein